jgi:hypothetical protein
MRSCEYHNLVIFIGFLQTFNCIRSNINTSLDSLTIGKSHIYHLVTGVVFNVIDAMHQRFIQVKYYGFLYYRTDQHW